MLMLVIGIDRLLALLCPFRYNGWKTKPYTVYVCLPPALYVIGKALYVGFEMDDHVLVSFS